MNQLKDKLAILLEDRGWSLKELSDKSDISYEVLRNIMYSKTDDIKAFKILKPIAEAFNVTTDFLLGITTYPKDEMELLRNFRKSSSHGKQFILSMSKFESAYTEFENQQIDIKEIDCYMPEVTEKTDGNRKILYYVPCLEPTGLFQDGVLYDTSIKTRIKTHLKDVFMAFKIPNDSLADTYYKGDIILLQHRRPQVGEIAIYYKDNYIYIRQYGRDETRHILHSLNINNEDIILSNAEMKEYKVLGTCIYVPRKTKEPQ